MVFSMPTNQALLMSIISGVVFFIVGNPITYAMVSKLTKLSPKKQTQHYLLVGIHAVVSIFVSYAVYTLANLPKATPEFCSDLMPPPCPKPEPCPEPEPCDECSADDA